MSHDSKLRLHQNNKRSDDSGARVGSQEKTLAVLLEQAFRITEEVATGLQSSKGSIQVEALSRKLLESHILTVTHIVRQLSVGIQALERHMSQRDSVSSGTALAVQSLDQKNLAGIGDLRGRVSRCDDSLAKLSVDISAAEQRMIALQQEMRDLRLVVDTKLQDLDVKLHRGLQGLEVSLTEVNNKQREVETDIQSKVKLLEDKICRLLEEVREQTDLLKKWTEQQLLTDNSAEEPATQLGIVEAQCRFSGQFLALDARLEQADQNNAKQIKKHEYNLGRRMKSVENSLGEELQLLKQEYHKGFLSVHDAIQSLRQIGDIKSHLDKEKLQKDIRHICCKVADSSD
ncbi:protein FAM81B [Cynoglossus semilaevis]|uniref:protein FAM81B n=1 Tax=Cynoglossus semilaevis TaxID=244447 RepID=UPI000D623DA8|nr:protein FAM81B [Cynoglossus semilaevis]